MTLVVVPPPPGAPLLRIEAFPKPVAAPAPRARALAVLAAIVVTCGGIATLVALALR